MSVLVALLRSGSLDPLPVPDHPDADLLDVLDAMAALMHPSGPWVQPVARFVARAPEDLPSRGGALTLTYHAFLGRLALELIASPLLRDTFAVMEPAAPVRTARKREQYPATFVSHEAKGDGRDKQESDARFSLPAIMRLAENCGYRWVGGGGAKEKG